MQKVKYNTLTISLHENEINNLYHPSAEFPIESYDEITVKKGFTFEHAPILLKEWFFLLKPGARLVLTYKSGANESSIELERILWWLFPGNYDIESHVTVKNIGKISLIKRNSLFQRGDSVEKWTFGIITNGERDDWMEEIIASIKSLKVPHYEIIVCGKYRERKEKNFHYIPFNERAERGWITKKKNLICEKSHYENICIIHDRLIFDKDWFKGMKKYGNAFELLGCVQMDKSTGEPAGDWLTHGGPIESRYKISRLKYEDWDYNVYLSGQLTIMKRSIWQKVLWDETRYWGEEDVDISFRARNMGYIIRFNSYAKIIAITWRHGRLPFRYRRTEGILPKDMLMRRIMRNTAAIFLMLPFMEGFQENMYAFVSKTKLYKHFIYH